MIGAEERRASTLDIIAGIKQKLIDDQGDRCRTTLKIAPHRRPVGVRRAARSSGVVREGVIAARLTSADDPAVPRQLALDASSSRSRSRCRSWRRSSCCRALGETLNIMTLGGLALAVGILVDDATVDDREHQLASGAGQGRRDRRSSTAPTQIVTPAFVSTLCICIVFVPMFFLTGVARFLFVPMAEAVVFAMICVVHPVAHAGADDGEVPAAAACPSRRAGQPPSRNPLVRFQRGFEARLRARPRAATATCWRWRCARAAAVRDRLPRLSCALSFLLVPFLGRNFFPSVDAGQILLHVARPGRHARRGDRATSSPTSRRRSARSSRRGEIETHRRQHRPADQRHQPVLQQHRRRSARRTATSRSSSSEGHRPTADYVRELRERAAASVSRACTFSFLPADIVSQILNFGAPAPIDVQIRGAEPRRRISPTPTSCCARSGTIPGIADARIQQSPNNPSFNVDVDRTRAQYVGLTERDVTNSLRGQSGRQLARSRRPSGSIPTTACPIRS